mmetsp:Transcript_5191/g.14584  ORF Transcript_5191/g.14584 Transcript_5191/m.14584 type:complete len:524 (+) Transcript_5191:218-1789(+)
MTDLDEIKSTPFTEYRNTENDEDAEDDSAGDDSPEGINYDLLRKAGLEEGDIPETEEDLQKAEQIVSEELGKLSMYDHEAIMMDVVGFRHDDMDDDSLNAKLAELERHVKRIKGKKKEAYEEARRLNPEYVNGRNLRLCCLRSCQYDAKRAARAVVHHFRMKKEVFPNCPPELLGRSVKFSDLSPDAQEFVERGYVQDSPCRDAAGRPVGFFDAGRKQYNSVESFLQGVWYTMSCKARDGDDAVRKGMVMVVYTGGVPEQMEIFIALHKLKQCFGVDVNAIHLCDTTRAQRFFLSASKLYMDNFTRFRTLEHSGTHEEINFALQTYGINTDDSPLKPDNTLDTALHKKWLEAQKQYEENTSGDTILFLHRFDVLFGKNKRCTHHPGTMRCQLLVEIHWEEYERQNRLERGQTAANIVGIVHESHGRFLKWDGDNTTGGWKEVDDDTARKKVTHYFRGIRERKQKGQNQTNISAPKRGIDSENQTYTSGSITRASSSTKVSDASLFAKRIRAPGLDNISESLET